MSLPTATYGFLSPVSGIIPPSNPTHHYSPLRVLALQTPSICPTHILINLWVAYIVFGGWTASPDTSHEGFLGACVSLDDSVELQLHDTPPTPIFRSSSYTNDETVHSPLPIVIVSSFDN
jgi:hypothetical protein